MDFLEDLEPCKNILLVRVDACQSGKRMEVNKTVMKVKDCFLRNPQVFSMTLHYIQPSPDGWVNRQNRV